MFYELFSLGPFFLLELPVGIFSCVRKHGIMVWTTFADDHEIKDYIQCVLCCCCVWSLEHPIPIISNLDYNIFIVICLSFCILFWVSHDLKLGLESWYSPGEYILLTQIWVLKIYLILVFARSLQSKWWASFGKRWSSRLWNCASSISRRSDSHSQWMFLNLFHRMGSICSRGVCLFGLGFALLGYDEVGHLSVFFFLNQTLVLDFLLFFLSPFSFSFLFFLQCLLLLSY